MNLEQLKIISAGAGSGKTYRLTEEMVSLLKSGEVRPNGIVATTFTRKAAAELQERVRVKLLSDGLSTAADELGNALIGTVHGLGVKLLRRFAFEAGVSPQVDILPDGEQQQMFNQSLAAILELELIENMDKLVDRLGLSKRMGFYDWRKEVRNIIDIARANDFSIDDMNASRQKSWESFQAFLPKVSTKEEATAYQELKQQINDTIAALEQGEDHTKVTSTAKNQLAASLRELELRTHLYWHQWAKLGKLKVGAKSRFVVEGLHDFAWKHESLPAFQADIKRFIDLLFQTAIAAMKEFDAYKKRRGLIDYTDMEVLVSRLLDQKSVQEVLSDELDLLMVDEFQDTSPIQLEIFLKLSKLTKYSVWVGDPKQSIYGFRGADPRLMQAIIDAAGGVKKENIQINSWRTRAELVYFSNALFCKAFNTMPSEQVALEPIRIPEGNQFSIPESTDMEQALIHWHFDWDGDQKRSPAQPWMEDCIANSLKEWLESKVVFQPKGTKIFRAVKGGDVAILCRSNAACVAMAEAIQRTGLKAAIATSGLLNTAEARLILACLKYILQAEDALSVAEILILTGQQDLQTMVEDRLTYVQEYEETPYYQRPPWSEENAIIGRLDELRPRLAEMSSAETLDLLLETLDLRRFIVTWGNAEQRLSNVDCLRKLALEYEANCNNTHTAASLGGLLLWLNTLAAKKEDYQGAAEDADAINVLTYHKSKGLEWPVVICHSLEQKLRADLWGMELVAEQEDVDLNQVLKGRWLRYWVNPYGDQQSKTPLLERMATSKEQTVKKEQALAEEARLMYVGITRARDYLILPSRRNTATQWLNRTWGDSEGKIPVLDPNTPETPWEWDGRFLDKSTRVFIHPRQFPVAESSIEPISFLEKPVGSSHQAIYDITASDWIEGQDIVFTTAKTHTYFPHKVDLEEDDKVNWAKVQAHFMKACLYLNDKESMLAIAAGLLARFDCPDHIEVRILVDQALAWKNWLKQTFPNANYKQGFPINSIKDGCRLSLQIDLIAQTETNIGLIQNQLLTGDAPTKRILEKGADLWVGGELLRGLNGTLKPSGRIFNTSSFSYWVHLVDKGQVTLVKREG